MGLLKVGQLVTSKMGRDSRKSYVVVGLKDNKHALVADGFIRKLARPKKKNLKHLIVHNQSLEAEGLTDEQIRKFIDQHSTEDDREGGC